MRTGGYGYDRRVVAGLRDLGWTVDLLPLGAGFPYPRDLAAAERALSGVPDGTTVLIDGLAFGVLDAWAARDAARLRLFALVHHPLALEDGADPALEMSERAALRHARGVIVTSPATARDVSRMFGVEDALVAIPGTDPAPLALGQGDPPHILSIGTLIRRKGHDVLIDALAQLADLPWRATIIGAALDPAVADDLHHRIRQAGLAARIDLAGGVEDTRAALATADIFALASRFEGYGMVFAEAMSQGLPIVACHAGAVPDVVPDTAGHLVPPDDPHAFAAALRALLADSARRRAYAAGSAAAGACLPGWSDTAARIAHFITERS
nr:glycosyltransferase [Falsirhodobacter halotolerans]